MKQGNSLKATVLAFAVVLSVISISGLGSSRTVSKEETKVSAVQTEAPEDVRKEARGLFGEDVVAAAERSVSPLVSKLCEPHKFYNVTIHQEVRIAGFGPKRPYLMAFDKQGHKLSNAREVALFLTNLKKPASSELEVLERVVVFAELIGRKVRTHIPKRKSLIKEYAQQKPEDWQVVISGTEAGWMVAVTLWRINDRRLENCWRYELDISKAGEVSIVSERLVYQYAALR
jgi:hypothetical protein